MVRFFFPNRFSASSSPYRKSFSTSSTESTKKKPAFIISSVSKAATAFSFFAFTTICISQQQKQQRFSTQVAAFSHPTPTIVRNTLLKNTSTIKSSTSTSLQASKNNNNPFQSMFGDMASSFLSSVTTSSTTDYSINLNQIESDLNEIIDDTSWQNIHKSLQEKQLPHEKEFRENVEKGLIASPLNKIRLFGKDQKEEDIRVTLYRDHASWCPYCHKVWMTLEEKEIPYKVEKINMRCYGEKPPSFNRLQPSGAIPVAIIDGVVYNQSNDIIFALEQIFTSNNEKKHKALLPSDPKGRSRAQELMRLERQLFSAWMTWLTAGYAKSNFISVLSEVEAELEGTKGGDFFLGKEVSLVDFMFAPFLERMAASMLYFKGFQMRYAPEDSEKNDWPAINRWFDAMETLGSYQLTKSDYYTHCWDLPPQLGGCASEPEGKAYEQAINGERSITSSSNNNIVKGSWELPLEPHNGGIEPDWDWCSTDDKASAAAAALREATERLTHNHENIVAFAARGAGKKGMPPYMAPLSDPNATPNEYVKGTIDAVLKIISLAMLEGKEDSGHVKSLYDDKMKQMAEKIVIQSDGDNTNMNQVFAEDIVQSLAYLRDRVGVPRDMRLPAARQLRAHLNWSIGHILTVKDNI